MYKEVRALRERYMDKISGIPASDDSQRKIRETPPLPLVSSEPESPPSPTTDIGVSSIEKSKAVSPLVVPPMNNPILTAPSEQESIAFAIASLDSSGRPELNTVRSFILKGEEIKNDVLQGWMKNLREIEEYVRALLASPVYQQLQDMRQKEKIEASGVHSVGSSSPTGGGQPRFLSTLDRLQSLSQVSSTEKPDEMTPSKDASQVLILPLTAALLASGGIALGSAHAVSSMGGVVEFIAQVQLIFPAISVQNIVPLINLLIVGPIYFHSWNEAVGNLRARDRNNHTEMIHNFAKDVIKMISDPKFVSSVLVQHMKGAEHMPQEEQERLASVFKILLVGVALSLLYSLEVGKVQQGKFGGMEPEEMRALLLGKFAPPPGKETNSPQEFLTNSLIKRTFENLHALQLKDRAPIVDILLGFIMEKQDVSAMLDPAKIFSQTIASSSFTIEGQNGMMKA